MRKQDTLLTYPKVTKHCCCSSARGPQSSSSVGSDGHVCPAARWHPADGAQRQPPAPAQHPASGKACLSQDFPPEKI